MTEFRNTFQSFADGSCTPSEWKKYFSEYNPEIWDAEGDGVLQYYSEDNKEFSLIIVHWRGVGFLLQLACRDLETNRSRWCKFSVSDSSKLTEFQEQDDLYYPVGCFLSPNEAWLAVEDFLNAPTNPSSRINWIDDHEISWPE